MNYNTDPDTIEARKSDLKESFSAGLTNQEVAAKYGSGHLVACLRALLAPEPVWTLPEPPKGKVWHRTDWTKDMLPEGTRPLLFDEARCRGDEILRDHRWEILGRSTDDVIGEPPRSITYHIRTRRPLPTEPKLVPWNRETTPAIPFGVVDKHGDKYTVIAAAGATVNIAPKGWHTYAELAKSFTLLDGSPCGNLE